MERYNRMAIQVKTYPHAEYNGTYITHYEWAKGKWWEKKWNKNNTKLQTKYSDGSIFIDKYDKRANHIYWEYNLEWWERRYDKYNREIFFKHSDGEWNKKRYNRRDEVISYEDYQGNYWNKRLMKGITNPYII